MLSRDSNSLCGVLYIDDEQKALKYFRMAFSQRFKVFTAESGKEGIELLRREAKNIGIVISDQRMPEMFGAEVLGFVREHFPQMVRILTTAYSDLESAIEAVNRGHIYQYVVKPWDIPGLGMVLQRAADYYHVLYERNELLALKMATLQRSICSDRLKWLMLSSRSWSLPAQSAFQRALIALVRGLPQTLNPVLTGSGQVSARDFDMSALIREEYQNALSCLNAIDRLETAPGAIATLDELNCGPVTSQLRAFASRGGARNGWRSAAALRINSFLAALIAKYDLGPDQIELTIREESFVDICLRLRPAGNTFRMGEFFTTLFGVMVERQTSELAILFLETLFALARDDASLTLVVEPARSHSPGWTMTFPLLKGSPDSPDDAISGLLEKFSIWDISNR